MMVLSVVTDGVSDTSTGPGHKARKKAWYTGQLSCGAVANMSKSGMSERCEVRIDMWVLNWMKSGCCSSYPRLKSSEFLQACQFSNAPELSDQAC